MTIQTATDKHRSASARVGARSRISMRFTNETAEAWGEVLAGPLYFWEHKNATVIMPKAYTHNVDMHLRFIWDHLKPALERRGIEATCIHDTLAWLNISTEGTQ